MIYLKETFFCNPNACLNSNSSLNLFHFLLFYLHLPQILLTNWIDKWEY